MSSGARRRARAAAVFLVAAAMVGALGTAVGTTAAQWSDQASFRATASAGTWAVTPVNTCEVRYQSNDALVPGRTCTVTFDNADIWGSAGAGQGYIRFYAHAPGILSAEYIAFSVTPTTAQMPAWWSWADATITSVEGGTVTSSCHTLPTVTGRKNANVGADPQIYYGVSDHGGCA